MRHIASKGYISEVFESLQGEGLFIGLPQVFVRLIGCNVFCGYCDTKYALKLNFTAELGAVKAINPVSVERVIKAITSYKGASSVSITGGEPLLQPEFTAELSSKLKARGFIVHLETNGTLPEALKKVINYVDVVAADIKLPSATGRQGYWKEHRAFLKIAGKKAFVKIVLTDRTSPGEIVKAIRLAVKCRRDMTVVLQPSPEMNYKNAVKIFNSVRKKIILKSMRLLPQLHKIMRIK
ncbi:MAG: 7-carboxy-7-deazaguanine synthase QueE [Candidatus Firestonebacteria bacterium]